MQAALAGRQLLLVIDDVWTEAHIQALLDASAGCARLITTRRPATLPCGAQASDVHTMNEADAVRLLGLGLEIGLAAGVEARLAALAGQLGHWPVLLRLANRSLREHLGQGLAVDAALDAVGRDLGRGGVAAFDPDSDVLERDQAVAATVEASLALLKPAERQRYAELTVFAQDVPIPLARAAEQWRLTAGLDEDASRDLVAKRLDPLSLLNYDARAGLLRLHDVLRRYLFDQLAGRAALHQRLADHWTDRPAKGRSYAWRWLAHPRAQAAIAADPPERRDRAGGPCAAPGGGPPRYSTPCTALAQGYDGRRPGGLPSPAQQCNDQSLAALQALYQRPWDDFVRINDAGGRCSLATRWSCPTRACCR